MQLKPYTTVFHSIIVHKDHNVPIQLGCRYINPAIAPDFLKQDFSRITVSDYLLGIAPVTAVEHIVEALIPDPWIRDLLQINAAEPCLALHRKTWVGEPDCHQQHLLLAGLPLYPRRHVHTHISRQHWYFITTCTTLATKKSRYFFQSWKESNCSHGSQRRSWTRAWN